MDESTDPERRDGGPSHARGTHQVGKTSQTPPQRHAGGKHQAGKTGQADPKPGHGKHAAPPRDGHGTGDLAAQGRVTIRCAGRFPA